MKLIFDFVYFLSLLAYEKHFMAQEMSERKLVSSIKLYSSQLYYMIKKNAILQVLTIQLNFFNKIYY